MRFKGISTKFEGCFKKVSRMFQENIKCVSREIQGCFNGWSFKWVSRVKEVQWVLEEEFQKCFKEVLRVLQER